MYQLAKITGVLIAVTALNGCVIAIGNGDKNDGADWQARQERNNRYIDQLELGTSVSVVKLDLGEPDFNESFQRNGDTYQVLYYRTHRVDSDGRTTKDETTPFVFIDMALVGWGHTAIDKATR